MKFRLLIITSAFMSLAACNKDGFVEDDDNGESNRKPSTTSQAACDKVIEWTPAPGQFINDTATMKTEITSADEAAEWAQRMLDAGEVVSLGGFGGYIIVGFDHSIANSGGYDIAIAGNAFVTVSSQGSSNEPGIVFVMQDTNRNGLPDDIWYELLGSESLEETADRDYEVTYFRPSAPQQDIRWTDNRGSDGTIDYLKTYHSQDYYYPMWIKGDSYTLAGTSLKTNNSQDSQTSNWANAPFEWGYADNFGSDNFKYGPTRQCNRFKISDAVKADLSPANLSHIDFVKIQTGVNAKSGWLGEVSTEVGPVYDLNLCE